MQDAVDLDTILAKAHQFSTVHELRAQPIPVIIGPQNKIAACYVVLNDYAYEVPSLLKAIDLTFKICYCLDCKYPPDAYFLWMLLQKAFYCIDSHGDRVSISLNSIIGEVRRVIEKNQTL